jgi:peptidoglycan/xylan/chitin deacetylase (PgdA/CDA1 family)
MGADLPILLYHRVLNGGGPQQRFDVTVDALRRQMELLAASGRRTFTISELAARIPQGPGDAVAITFDDGTADFYQRAWRVLADLDLAVTLYVTAGLVGGRHLGSRMLTWEQLEELRDAGVEIGAHGYRHVALDAIPFDQAALELVNSKLVLEDRLGIPVQSFAYPFGYHSPAIKRLLPRSGYTSGCAVKNRQSHPRDDRYALARVTVGADTTLRELEELLNGGGPPPAWAGERLRTRAWRAYRREAPRLEPARRRAAAVAPWLIPPLCALVGCLALARADPTRVGDLGLISAIPAAAFACLGLLSVGFALALRPSRPRPVLLAAHLVVFVLLLHGAPALVEHEPRFPTAWLHAGFTNYIGATGSTLPGLDARFNWPGFFAAAALLTRALGLHDPTALLRWTPLAFELLALAPVYVIATSTSDDARVPWIAAWLFIPANWVGQDYFSPQALAFILFLAFMVVLLRYFGRSAGDERRLAGAPPAGGLFGILLLTYCAVVWSHQLTPYFVIAATATLVVLGACRLRSLPLLLIVIVAAFVSYLAVPYWAGHLRDIFGGVGELGSTLSSNVGSRVGGGGAHEWVPRLRVVLTGAVWALVLVGAVARWRRARRSTIVLLALVAAPYSVLALQAYGGEAILRSYLFSLPFAAVLMAVCFTSFPRRSGSVIAPIALVLVTGSLVGGFFVARYGNEAFEMVRPGEVAALERLYSVAPPGSTFVSLDESVPWRFTGISRFSYATVPPRQHSPELYLRHVRRAIGTGPRSGYLVITRGQIEYARLRLGVPSRWVAAVYRRLAISRHFRLIYSNPDARLYGYDRAAHAPARRDGLR